MLCAFSNHNDLDVCINRLGRIDEVSTQDMVIFEAAMTPPQETSDSYLCDQAKVSFYAVLLTKGKVNTVPDLRSIDELRNQFKSVSSDVVEKVWESQHNWGACFDVLNSLLNSHGGSLVLEDCEFAFDSALWPPLQSACRGTSIGASSYSSPFCMTGADGTLTPNSLRSGDWSIVDVHTIHVAMERMQLGNPGVATHDDDNDDNDENDDSWEMLSDPVADVDSFHSASASERLASDSGRQLPVVPAAFPSPVPVGPLVVGGGRSYRDVAAMPAAGAGAGGAAATATVKFRLNAVSVRRPEWKPTIIVQTQKMAFYRKDRMYQYQQTALSTTAAADDDEYDSDYDFGEASISRTTTLTDSDSKNSMYSKHCIKATPMNHHQYHFHHICAPESKLSILRYCIAYYYYYHHL